MKGSVRYTRIKITNCENNFLCSGKTNALKRTVNIGSRRFFDWDGAFHSIKAEGARKKRFFHAPWRSQKAVKRDLERNLFWPPRCKTLCNLWKEVASDWPMRLIADFHCLVWRYWKPIYKAFIWRACCGRTAFFCQQYTTLLWLTSQAAR